MKRSAYAAGMADRKAQAIRRRKFARSTGLSATAMYGPVRRTYSGSLVPMRSGGYTPNRTERKVNDINTATYNISTTGSITLLCNPTLGSDFNNRIGRKIVLKSAYIRGRVVTEASQSAVLTNNNCFQARFILFSDLQPNGAAPAVTDLLIEALPSSQLNLNNRDRFKIYCDKEFLFDPWMFSTTATQTYSSASRQGYNFKKYKKINLESIYNATNGGTIADIQSGALYMMWIGNTAAGAGSDGNAILSTRVRYADL